MQQVDTYFRDLRGSYMVRCDNGAAKTLRCYRWERATFQPICKRDFTGNRPAAKGFTRLLLKVGARKLAQRLGKSEEWAQRVVAGCSIRHAALPHKACLGGANGVFFAAWGWTDWVMAHEIAHYLDAVEAETVRDLRSGHGMTWLGWYAFLLVEVCGYPRDLVQSSLRDHGLRWSSRF